jgi:hypothetical protein
MAAGRKEDASCADVCDERLLFIFFLIVILFFFLWEVAIFGNFLLLVLFVIIVIIGNDVQMDGMDLRDFQLGLALRATENLAFFDFILVDVDFGGTFWAADHGSILRKWFMSAPLGPRAPQSSVLYTGVKSTPAAWNVAVNEALGRKGYGC